MVRRSKKRKVKGPVWWIMGGLWVLLLSSLSWGIYGSYSKRRAAREGYQEALREGFSALQKGDHASLLLARDAFVRALKLNQRELRVWAAVALIEARRELLFGVRSSLFSHYRNGGTALLSEVGADSLDRHGLALWQEALLTHQLALARGRRELERLYFLSRREWGARKFHSGLGALYSMTECILGGDSAAERLLSDAKGVHELYVRALVSLHRGDQKSAMADLQTVLSLNPEHDLAFLSFAALKGATYRSRHKARIARLLGSLVPYHRSTARFIAELDGSSRSSAPAGRMPLWVLRASLERALNRGNEPRARVLWERYEKRVNSTTARARVLKARLLFVQGRPREAWEAVRDLTPQERGNHGVKFLWFAGRYREAKREARHLEEADHWYRLAYGLCGPKVGTALHTVAHLWQASERESLSPEVLSGLSSDHEARLYTALLHAKVNLAEGYGEGLGWQHSHLLCEKALKRLKGSQGETPPGKRLRARALRCVGETTKALRLAESICQGRQKKKNRGCVAPGTEFEDRAFYLTLLLDWESPEKDLELAYGRARQLLPRVAKTADQRLSYEARLTLLRITLMPGSTQRSIKRTLAMIDPRQKYSGSTLRALAPLYALMGQSGKTLQIWKKYFGKYPLESAHLAQFLKEVGSPKEALAIASATCAGRRCTNATRARARRALGLSKVALGQDAVKIFEELLSQAPSVQAREDLFGALLSPPHVNQKNFKGHCESALKLLEALPRGGSDPVRLVKSLIPCGSNISVARLKGWVQKLPAARKERVQKIVASSWRGE